MKIKAVTIFTIFLLLFTCFSVLAFEQNSRDVYFEILSCGDNFVFSQASFEKVDDFTKLELSEATSYTMDTGKPMLPVVVKTYVFPRYTKIKNVECTFSGFSEQKISEKIMPAPQKLPLININKNIVEDNYVFDASAYESSQVYPSKNYDYSITSGIDGLTVSIRMYPVAYKPAEDIIQTYDFADINVVYEKPSFTAFYEEEYDMVIISPNLFNPHLRRLVNHKNDVGVKTFLMTTEEIYTEYEGRDEPEQIKYFIKDAIETYNISYVLLVGGMKGVRKQWHVPVRYSNLDDKTAKDKDGYISDLYYADIYKYNESSNQTEFECWDSNGNDVFAEWNKTHFDIIDGVPDVYVGRLACRNIREVRTVVDKIITYETMNQDPLWSKKMICVAGDTFYDPDDPDEVNEGEYISDIASDIMKNSGYDIIKLYASTGAFTGPSSVITEINKGAGLMFFSGHANPRVFSTHPPQNEKVWITALNIDHMNLLANKNKLPIVFVASCSSSQFDVTPLNFIEGIKKYGLSYFSLNESNPGRFWYNEWPRECWSWSFVSAKRGGAIATIGYTGLGYGSWAGDISYSDWISIAFFDAIGNQTKTTLGTAHSTALSDYISEFGINNYDKDDGYIHRKTVDSLTLLGDPSLMIGGYS